MYQLEQIQYVELSYHKATINKQAYQLGSEQYLDVSFICKQYYPAPVCFDLMCLCFSQVFSEMSRVPSLNMKISRN